MTRVKSMASIRVVASLAAVVLLALAVIAMATVSERHASRTLTEEIETRLLLTARNLALVGSDALLEDYPELVLAPIVKDLQLERSELAFVIVTDAAGTIRGHADMQKLGTPFEIPGEGWQSRTAAVQAGEQLLEDPQLLVAIAPVMLGTGEQAGHAIVGLQREYMTARIAAARRSQITVFAIVLVIGTLAALATVTWLLRPLGPLRRGLERIGRGDLDTRLEVYSRNELGLLAHTVNHMTSELKNAQMELVHKERLNHEMMLAQEIQTSLRPNDWTDRGPFVVRGSQRAASEVGGDYYGVFDLPDGRVGVAIADVAGKGLAGCLAASMLAAFTQAFHSIVLSPGTLLTTLDRHLSTSLAPGTFVTMFYGVLDPEKDEIEFASAGHMPAAVYRRATSTVEWFHPRGRPLASFRRKSRSLSVEEVRVTLAPGDLLMQFTDGISEAWHRGDRSQQFGFQRIQRVLVEHGADGSKEVILRLQQAVDDWVGHHHHLDDETILVVGYDNGARVKSLDEAQFGVHARALSKIGDEEVLESLNAKRLSGEVLTIPAKLEDLSRIKVWLDDNSSRLGLLPEQSPAHIALYEIAANIIEHGYHHDATSTLEIYWVAPPYAGSTSSQHGVSLDPERALAMSYFVVCDRAAAFKPNSNAWAFRTEDVIDREGRGLGLSIVHRVVEEIDYRHSPTYGNMTLLRLGPRRETT